MLYLTDANTDPKAERMHSVKRAAPELLSEFCPDIYIPVMLSWGIPALTRFIHEQTADAEQVAELIEACKQIPVEPVRLGLISAFETAVPPVELRTD